MSAPGPRYFNGQVLLVTLDRGAVVVDEPAWCIGHSWQPNPHRDDITHYATRSKVDVTTERAGRTDLLAARISWAPFTELVPLVSVELGIEGDYQAEEVGPLAAGLRAAAERLERLASDAIRLRGRS